jgi:phosphate transport system substrate-binding protein
VRSDTVPQTRSLLRLLAILLTLGLVAAACGSDDDDASGSDTAGEEGGSGTGDLSKLSGTLNGSGSSFQNNLELAVIDAFGEEASGVTINYNAVGSGQGKSELMNQVTDFAGSDSLVSEADKSRFKGGEFLYFPIATAPITVSYNLPGVDELHLSPATLAKLFAGKIKRWDDAAVKADNPNAKLPSTAVTVAHRSDGSGTTNVFTNYLTKVGGSDWTIGAGDSVAWPGDTQGGNKNAGVAQIITQTAGAIGYVDFSDAVAAKLKFAAVKNKDGKFVVPTTEACEEAAAGTTVNADLTLLPLDSAGAKAYPICAPTYVIAYKNQTSKAKGEILKAYLDYMLTDGQEIAEELYFSPLSSDLAKKAVDQLGQLVIPAS